MPTIEFRKFKPTLDLAKHAETILLQLADFVPTGATVFAYITKLKKKYLCLIQVTSQAGSFVQKAQAPDPALAITDVNEKLKSALMEWQLDHFHIEEDSFWDFKEVKI